MHIEAIPCKLHCISPSLSPKMDGKSHPMLINIGLMWKARQRFGRPVILRLWRLRIAPALSERLEDRSSRVHNESRRVCLCKVADCHSGVRSPAVVLPWNAIARSRATRMAMGGCVARKSAIRPDFALTLRPSGSAMHRCATPALMLGVGAPACSILSRADARDMGFRVN